jgi:hypothetical protein
MTEPETEAETLERLEHALRRIGELARQPKSAAAGSAGPEIDRGALLHALDLLINRLRTGLEPAKPGPVEYGGLTDGASNHSH